LLRSIIIDDASSSVDDEVLMNDGSDPQRNPPQQKGQRRPYSRPQLTRLGTLTELTAQVANNSQMGDGHGMKTA
jgi:hypothetical protein